MTLSILGVSRSGKTCYISAMSQVLKQWTLKNNIHLSIKANDYAQQLKLDDDFKKMISERRWPRTTDETTSYDFRISINGDKCFSLPSLKADDYRGGMLTGMGKNDKEDRDAFFSTLKDSAVVVFLIDAITILNAMDNLDKDALHREPIELVEQLESRNQISIMENILFEFGQDNELPPIMLAITKSDIFASQEEYNKAVALVKKLMPSLFFQGSNAFVAITSVSLGKNLGKGDNDAILGQLQIGNSDNNIHIPMLFALYAYLDATYDEYKDKNFVDTVMASIRAEFTGSVIFYINGVEALAV